MRAATEIPASAQLDAVAASFDFDHKIVPEPRQGDGLGRDADQANAVEVARSRIVFRNRVHAEARGEHVAVVAGAAVEHVVALAAVEHVIAGAPVQLVVAVAAGEHVVAGIADELVVVGAAIDQVVTRPAVEQVVARLA